jgi:Phosphopantetheine attachment site.
MDSLKLEIKQLLIEALDLEDLSPADIDDDAPLFDTDGIGLDSIDALEIGIVLRKQYQLTLAANDERTREHFRSDQHAGRAGRESTRNGACCERNHKKRD